MSQLINGLDFEHFDQVYLCGGILGFKIFPRNVKLRFFYFLFILGAFLKISYGKIQTM